MSIYNTLIVYEDISQVRTTLQQVHWSDLNVKSASIVRNADAAFAILAQKKINCVIMNADATCQNGVRFISRLVERYPDVAVIIIDNVRDPRLLLDLMRIPQVYNYISYPLVAAEVEKTLGKTLQVHEQLQMAYVVYHYSDLSSFSVDPAKLKEVQLRIRSIVHDAEHNHSSAAVQGVSGLFQDMLELSNKEDIHFSKAVANELIHQLRYMLSAKSLETGSEFALNGFAAHLLDAMDNAPLEDLCLFYLNRALKLINPGGVGAQVSALVRSALKITQRRYADSNFSLVSLADEIGVSPNYLSSIFKMETGVRFKQYLNSYRMELAKGLLRDGKYKIYEVSNMVGIEDSRYFSQLFRCHTGLKPSEFRNVYNLDNSSIQVLGDN